MRDNRVILEIACFTYGSACIAAKSEADRIEFCSGYASGGLTPSLEELIKIKKSVRQPVFVMIRPREGNFVYSDAEFEQMKKEIVQVKELGFEGVVFGILNEKNEIDIEKNKLLVELSKPMEVTFHRAFDLLNDQFRGLDELISIGVKRVLTSGNKKTAVEGKERIKELVNYAKEKITIIAGGGIRSENVYELLECGIREVHSSGILSGEVCDGEEINLMKNKIII